jgi:hypothetical protein
MRKPIFFLCIVIIVLCGCKKKQHVIYYSVPDALKKACLFQKGSYWVYLNDSTHITDSVYLMSDPVAGSLTDNLNNIVYNYTTLLKSRFLFDFYIAGEFVNSASNGCPFLVGINNLGYCSPGRPAYILFNDTLTNHRGHESYQCGDFKDAVYENTDYTELGSLSTYNINNQSFNNVLITRNIFIFKYINPSDKDTIDFYFSPGIGLIHYIFRGDTSIQYNISSHGTISWSLLRYKVVQ